MKTDVTRRWIDSEGTPPRPPATCARVRECVVVWVHTQMQSTTVTHTHTHTHTHSCPCSCRLNSAGHFRARKHRLRLYGCLDPRASVRPS